MKKITQNILKILAKLVLKKYKPEVIAITGSVGKTSTKEAIYTVLKKKFLVRRSIKNYNNELGVPLTILNSLAAGKSLSGWLKIYFKGLKLIFKRDKTYPKILVLEMAADKIGDIKYLTSFVPRKAGVVTTVEKVHLEYFGSLEKIAAEKQGVVSDLKKNAYAVLNADNPLIYNMEQKTKAKILTFGFSEKAQIKAAELAISEKNGIKGISFKLVGDGKVVPVFLPAIIGKQQVYAALAAVCVGIIYGMNLLEISEALKTYKAPSGRMNLIKGIKNSLIIDDTYNASPASTLAALEALENISFSKRKLAILGDMLELGNYTEEGHREVGKKAAKVVNFLITVGERARDIKRGALENGFDPKSVFNFPDITVAGKFAQEKIQEGDIILIKGSQGMRMEKITKELMADPSRAKELIVRQDEEWQKK